MCTHAALSILGRSRGKSLCNHNPCDVEEKLVAKYCSVAHRYALSCHYSADFFSNPVMVQRQFMPLQTTLGLLEFGILASNKTLRKAALWYSINFFTSHIFLREIQQSLVKIIFNVVCIIIDHAVSDLANYDSLRLLDFQFSQKSSRGEGEEGGKANMTSKIFSLCFSSFCVSPSRPNSK